MALVRRDVTTTFRIVVSPAPESNDHQVRYLLSGKDLIAGLWGDMLGLDPDEVLMQPCPLLPSTARGPVTVARCSCGVTGCGSEEVSLHEANDVVRWMSKGKSLLSVDAGDYRREVIRALADFSWETPDRTASRLFKARFDPTRLEQAGLTLEWASGRVRRGKFTSSLRLRENGLYQVLVSIPWRKLGLRRHSAPPDVVANDLVAELSKSPDLWGDVEWSPMEQGLGPPGCAGPRWRPLTSAWS